MKIGAYELKLGTSIWEKRNQIFSDVALCYPVC